MKKQKTRLSHLENGDKFRIIYTEKYFKYRIECGVNKINEATDSIYVFSKKEKSTFIFHNSSAGFIPNFTCKNHYITIEP